MASPGRDVVSAGMDAASLILSAGGCHHPPLLLAETASLIAVSAQQLTGC